MFNTNASIEHIDIKYQNIDLIALWDLFESLRDNNSSLVLRQGRIYKHPVTKKPYVFNLSVIGRQRRSKNLSPYEVRYAYDIFDSSGQNLGSGSFGVVYPIEKTLSYNPGKSQPHLSTKSRVVKVYFYINPMSIYSPEFEWYNPINHLKNKRVVKDKYLTMRRLPGRPLGSLLAKPYTLKEKLDLSISIMRAYKLQVLDANIFHQDLHPGNILIDTESNPYIVNIIDFNWAQDLDIDGFRSAQVTKDFIDLKSCIFRLWGIKSNYLFMQDFMKMSDLDSAISYLQSLNTEFQLDADGFAYGFFLDPQEQKIYDMLIDCVKKIQKKDISHFEFCRKFILDIKMNTQRWSRAQSPIERYKSVHSILVNLEELNKTIKNNPKIAWDFSEILKEIGLIILALVVLYPLVNYYRHHSFFAPPPLQAQTEQISQELKSLYSTDFAHT